MKFQNTNCVIDQNSYFFNKEIDFNSIIKTFKEYKISAVRVDKKNCTVEEITKLFNLLKNYSHSFFLNFTSCNIGDDRVIELAKQVNETKISNLFLHENNITDIGAEALASAILNNKSNLKSIDLSLNQITSKGGKLLVTALEQNKNMISINLQFNLAIKESPDIKNQILSITKSRREAEEREPSITTKILDKTSEILDKSGLFLKKLLLHTKQDFSISVKSFADVNDQGFKYHQTDTNEDSALLGDLVENQ